MVERITSLSIALHCQFIVNLIYISNNTPRSVQPWKLCDVGDPESNYNFCSFPLSRQCVENLISSQPILIKKFFLFGFLGRNLGVHLVVYFYLMNNIILDKKMFCGTPPNLTIFYDLYVKWSLLVNFFSFQIGVCVFEDYRYWENIR